VTSGVSTHDLFDAKISLWSAVGLTALLDLWLFVMLDACRSGKISTIYDHFIASLFLLCTWPGLLRRVAYSARLSMARRCSPLLCISWQ
jgi:hypothetical protein